MIDIKDTIYKSINDAFGALRYQAKDDPKVFKSILEVLIIDYMLHWACGELESLDNIQKLKNLRHELIMRSSLLRLSYSDTSLAYVNTNTPQTNSSWKRVWDAPRVLNISDDTAIINGKEYVKIDKLIINNQII